MTAYIGQSLHRAARDLGWTLHLADDGSGLFVLREVATEAETEPLTLERAGEFLDAVERRQNREGVA